MPTKKSKKSTIMVVAEPRGDYGIKYPCYGEYKCTRCKREWSSNVAWRYDGQQCKSCKYFRRPWKTEPLNSFLCVDESCGFKWKDKNPTSECHRCGKQGKMFKTPRERRNYLEYTRAHTLKSKDSEDEEPNIISKPHLRHLCERCQKSPVKDCQQLHGRPQKKSSGSGNGAVNKSTHRQLHELTEASKQYRLKLAESRENVPLMKKDAQQRTKHKHNLQEDYYAGRSPRDLSKPAYLEILT